MKFDHQALIYLVVGSGIGFINWFVASWKLRDKYCWFLLGLIFNLPSLLILLFLSTLSDEVQYAAQYKPQEEYYTKSSSKGSRQLLPLIYIVVGILLIYALFRLLINFID